MMRNRNKKGQSTLEYIVIFTVIIVALLAAIVTLFGKNETTGLGKLFKKASLKIETESRRISNYVLPNNAN